MAKKKISDEQLAAALLQHGTIRRTAAEVGISERTINDRMHDANFRMLYAEARNDVLRKSVAALNAKLLEAVRVTTEIMSDEEINAAVRLQACQTVINAACRLSERLRDDETGVCTLAENAAFSVFGM